MFFICKHCKTPFENNLTRVYCSRACYIADKAAKRAAAEAAKTAAPLKGKLCTRASCRYYNSYIRCCDYREIVGVGRGCKPWECDKYVSRKKDEKKGWVWRNGEKPI